MKLLIGEQIRKLRESRKVTQEEISDADAAIEKANQEVKPRERATKEDFKDDYCLLYKKDLDDFSSISYTSDHENYIPIMGNDLKVTVTKNTSKESYHIFLRQGRESLNRRCSGRN